MNDDARLSTLLNEWQQSLPLFSEPYALMGRALHCSGAEVIALLQRAQTQGALSRIGGVFAPGAGGAALLCALAVPPERLEAVAALVNALPGVNHNYEREHRYSLWFVITGASRESIEAQLLALEQSSGLAVLRLPMLRPYRINLGFDLRSQGPAAPAGRLSQRRRVAALSAEQRPLAALLEQGLPLTARPFAIWAEQLGWSEARVLTQLRDWLDSGVLRRLGVIVRHHELGFAANAMCVFDVPDERVDAIGTRLALQDGVTLCYRRARAEGWPYNLFCMIHGRERSSVLEALGRARAAAGLLDAPQAVLFSRRRFKQGGSRYFQEALPQARAMTEPAHA